MLSHKVFRSCRIQIYKGLMAQNMRLTSTKEEKIIEAKLTQIDSSGGGEVNLWYAISFAMQLGFLIVIPIGAFVFLGHWGDTKLQTSPVLLIAGVIVGLFTTVYEVYHLILPFTKNSNG